MKNTFGNALGLTIFGESHGAAVGAVLDGLAAGLPVDEAYIAERMDRRRARGDGLSTARTEPDVVEFLSGVVNGHTTGTPITMMIRNTNTRSGDYAKTADLLRPGHADYTAYAKYEGSAAAPTAGLHFTQELLQQIADKGIKIAYVTLHVGLGTFRPVKEENVLEHHMHSEYYQVTEEAANTINETKKNGGRVICVGTTSCRTVESAADEQGMVQPGCDNTEIFIYPGYRFKVLDALITNFHLPESTLVMLVSALAGREHILHAYEEAIHEKYRFFSFGDAMFIADLKGEK